MNKKYIVLFALGVLSMTGYSQIPEYVLYDKYQYADFNYQKIDSLDLEYPRGFNLLNDIFAVKEEGNYTVYRYLNYDKGILYDEGPISDIITLVMIKVNNENVIVDGYYYSLTNPEMPSTCHLYKLVNEIEFEERMNLRKLFFLRINLIENEKYDYLLCSFIDAYLDKDGVLICDNISD